MPTVVPVTDDGGVVKVYFSPRDHLNRSQVHWFKIDLRKPWNILEKSEGPVLTPGKRGAFDDSGITLGSYVGDAENGCLYYTGWNLTVSVPMNNSIGVAYLGSNGQFERLGDGPIMTRNLHEPYSCASPFVMECDGRFRMWYASMDDWKEVDGDPRHYYNIKYAESEDGVNWRRDGDVAIDYQGKEEYAFGRPCIIQEAGIFKMWYAFRGDYYTIGYAESDDGISWTRMDSRAGISVSEKGWDSEMIEYPAIYDALGRRFMFYNGNGYGMSGIGLAVLEA